MYNFIYLLKGSIIISNNQTLIQQFQSFYKDHHPKNFEDAVEKFAIFGGVNWGEVDTSKPSYELIQKLILDDYRFIRNDVTELTSGAPLYHSVLSGIAMGDGRTHSSFKRAKVDKDAGENAVEELVSRGIIRLDKAKNLFTSWDENEKVDNKLFYTTPFMRFWFAFVSPLFKGIRDGDYKEIKTRFLNRESEFVQLTFVELSHELLKRNFQDDKIVEIGTYWDRNIELDIYAKTASGKTVVGSCKYSNAKVKKSELSKLQEICTTAKIEADIFVLVSKKGFSNELKSLKSESLKLFTIKNFKSLVE
ncbi:MAG: DUF234 domain-containing protein [Sulfurimonas sp.]